MQHSPCLCRPAGTSFTVLGGQHTSRAIQVLAERRRKAGKAVLPWQTTVLATVVRAGTPPRVCAELAGDHQCRQGSVQSVTLSQWARLLLGEVGEDTEADLMPAVKHTIQISGLPRPNSQVW